MLAGASFKALRATMQRIAAALATRSIGLVGVAPVGIELFAISAELPRLGQGLVFYDATLALVAGLASCPPWTVPSRPAVEHERIAWPRIRACAIAGPARVSPLAAAILVQSRRSGSTTAEHLAQPHSSVSLLSPGTASPSSLACCANYTGDLANVFLTNQLSNRHIDRRQQLLEQKLALRSRITSHFDTGLSPGLHFKWFRVRRQLFPDDRGVFLRQFDTSPIRLLWRLFLVASFVKQTLFGQTHQLLGVEVDLMGYWKYSWLFQPVFQEEKNSQKH